MQENSSSNEKDTKAEEKPRKNKIKIWGIIVFVFGLITLIAGATFLIINIIKRQSIGDAEYLVQVGAWQREDEPAVVWDFTEIGKGTLTSNDHLNDYEFIWRIDGDKIKIETEWIYDLNDEFSYKLDQGRKSLTVTTESGDIKFVPAGGVDAEVTEND